MLATKLTSDPRHPKPTIGFVVLGESASYGLYFLKTHILAKSQRREPVTIQIQMPSYFAQPRTLPDGKEILYMSGDAVERGLNRGGDDSVILINGEPYRAWSDFEEIDQIRSGGRERRDGGMDYDRKILVLRLGGKLIAFHGPKIEPEVSETATETSE